MTFSPDSLYPRLIGYAGRAAELAGVGAILMGFVIASGMAISELRERTGREVFRSLRQRLGRAILLGLELLVAADIIGTVTEDPNLESVLVLGIIVLIRTFLSFTLELEIEGRWPWERRGDA
jgi:uncharacterized membrane protein